MEKASNICQDRQIWFDGRDIPVERQDIWSLINNSAISTVVVSKTQRKTGHFPARTQFVTEVEKAEDLKPGDGDMVMSQNADVLVKAADMGFKTVRFYQVSGREEMENAWREALLYNGIIVDFDLPTNIPLELIIARLQERKGSLLLKRVKTLEEMKVVFGVMEQGSDGVLLTTGDINEIAKVTGFLDSGTAGKMKLDKLTVTDVQHVGMGLRSCVDTTGMMTADEGMIVGSTSSGGIFVCSETHYLPYMNLRPFRVNAGAVHSYIWMPGNNAQYLTDLAVGSKVICVDTGGNTRELTVGRIKTEARPLLMIKGEAGGTEINVIVQDDWHIRIMGADGKPRNASEIKPGDSLLCHVCQPGRHVGIKVSETIIEK